MKAPTITSALCVLGAIAWYDAARAPVTTALAASPSAFHLRTGVPSASARFAPRPAAHESGAAMLPLYFERNRGQSPAEVQFAARGQGYGLFLTATEAVLVFSSPDAPSSETTVVRMAFAGASRAPVVSGVEELPGKVHYFHGRDAGRWRTSIPTYAKVAYRHLYPGIDLVYYGNQQRLEYDLIVAPEGDPALIALTFDGVDGLDISASGDLVLRAGGMEIRQQKPAIYQQVGDVRQAVAGRYVRRGPAEIGFEVGKYDASRTLVIDPMIAFSSYLGGTGFDMGQRIAVDATGAAYLTGTTASPDFPVTSGTPAANGLDEVFVAKVAPGGNALVYATYLGGSGNDRGRDVAIDATGRAYLTGSTDSADFPLRNAVQPTFGGSLGDAFVAELGAAGDTLIYSTYLGGTRRDAGESIAVDPSGSAYVTGSTISPDFPTTPKAFQTRLGGVDPSLDAFVTKLRPGGTAFAYSTFLGGGEGDGGTGIAVNARGHAFVTGVTGSGDFPRVRPFQPNAFLGITDAFVSKLSQDGSALIYSSNLGGDETDVGLDITVDAADRAIVGGLTTSDDFPLVRPLQPASGGSADGFVTIVSPAGSSLAFSTYLGGTGRDEITGIAADRAGGVYVVGRTFSTDFPTVRPVQAHAGGNLDAFVARMDVPRRQLVYATYLGGEADDDGTGIAIDSAGSAYVIGTTQSDGFPIARALQPGRAGGADAFFAKLTDFTSNNSCNCP